MVEWQTVLRVLASPSDPSGLARAETFWNSRSHGLRPWCFGQFQLSFSAEHVGCPALSAKSAQDRLPLILRLLLLQREGWVDGEKKEEMEPSGSLPLRANGCTGQRHPR